ncbi:MAG: uridine kinase [Clostridia bacterium]|nr:uridine kinase [Clostridia bacterium]
MKTVVGIAGGTASGKSTFTDLLVDALGDVKIGVIHMDSYFKRESERPHVASHLNGKVYVDDNCPDTIDWQGFHRDLDGMIAEDNDVIIAEGLLVLWDEHTRDCLDLKIFVDCRSDERLARRIKRNAQWGQSFEQVTDVFLNMVRFRHDQYVEPTKWIADVIVNGSGDKSLVCDMVKDAILKRVNQ